MILYFQPQPFYSAELETKVPASKELCISDFIGFLREYKRIESILDNQYKQNDENLWIVLGEKKGEIKPINHNDYNTLHSKFQDLRGYYQLLLMAVKNRHGIWLNDFIPDELREQTKKRKRKVATI